MFSLFYFFFLTLVGGGGLLEGYEDAAPTVQLDY